MAAKHKASYSDTKRKFTLYDGNGKKVIGIFIPRKGKKPLKATFGTKPIQTQKRTSITDTILKINTERTELVRRLLAGNCELCGKTGEKVYGHHIRKLKDLKKSQRGKREVPEWVKRMVAIKRKTLFVCKECHNKIHNGTYDGISLTQNLLESRMP